MELYILIIGIIAIGWILAKMYFAARAYQIASQKGNNVITRAFYGLTNRSFLVQAVLFALDVGISSTLAIAVRLTVPGRVGGAIHLTMSIVVSVALFVLAKQKTQ